MPEPKRRRKKSERAKLIAKCDVLFSKIVRDCGICQLCASQDVSKLQCAHGFSRRYLHTRFDLRNAFCLCKADHVHFTYRPLEWDNLLHRNWGDALYAELRARALSTDKVTTDDLIRTYKTLAEHWATLEAAANARAGFDPGP